MLPAALHFQYIQSAERRRSNAASGHQTAVRPLHLRTEFLPFGCKCCQSGRYLLSGSIAPRTKVFLQRNHHRQQSIPAGKDRLCKCGRFRLCKAIQTRSRKCCNILQVHSCCRLGRCTAEWLPMFLQRLHLGAWF